MSDPIREAYEPSGFSFLREEPARNLWRLWHVGQRPEVGQFLSQLGVIPTAQLVAVLRVDQWERWLHHDCVPVEDYLRRFPALQTGDAAIELMFGECLVREELGESPALEEYLRRFPQYADALQPKDDTPSDNAGDATRLQSSPRLTPAPPPAPTLPPGRPASAWPSVPGFEVLEFLGEGGMGVVYKARPVGDARVMASADKSVRLWRLPK
jgi:hypothetical protein